MMKDHAAILIHKDKLFLFVKRSKTKKTLPNIWAFPSGTKEPEESIYETAVRESFEELGVKVEAENTIATRELPELQTGMTTDIFGWHIIFSLKKSHQKCRVCC